MPSGPTSARPAVDLTHRLPPLGQVDPASKSQAQATLCGDQHPSPVYTASTLAITYRVNFNATRCAPPLRTKGASWLLTGFRVSWQELSLSWRWA
ncbi:hypothetical protein GCM10010524_27870 [Streptomyces mexicanus]